MTLQKFYFNYDKTNDTSKGQRILKANYLVLNSLKKRTKKFYPKGQSFFLFSILPKNERKTSARAKFCKHFFCFLEELRTRKIASEII